jgi:hypothetical protein
VLAEGEYALKDDLDAVYRLFGCRDLQLSFECRNLGPEEIVTAKLPGELGFTRNFINKEGKLVVAVALAISFEEPTVSFECGPNKNRLTLKGIVIAPVAPIDKMAKAVSVKLKQSKGKQMPAKLEGGGKQTLILQQTFPPMPPEQAGIASIDTNTNEEPMEIKAAE